ncbi:GntR family transcriptional regulator [Pontibacter mangrovi]|uniref:GntR family transcriptional regulator n=1 Tax=Pontibacter mangrovi TaxID=2589816 RepID=A0A501W881_9BACT|nr:GntR family transcriptional regulator [Pontibacter mangrovi]TPE44244.1 GntR family transcriptional regulator [Pontibacter mangrovi]
MEFRDNEAIYLQIAAYISERILLGEWPEEHKVPSVREMAVELQVNPNTVMRTYEFLQKQEVIYNKRGIGFFVAPDAAAKVKAYRKERFLEQDLPVFFTNLYLLGISLEELQGLYEKFTSDHYGASQKKES